MSVTSIRYLRRNEIEDLKWNRCIDNAANNLIYAYSFYLDFMSPEWHAIVAGDYDFIMPLTWRKKWGVLYLSQPAFVQQSGIFSKEVPGESLLTQIFAEIRRHFKFAEIFINYQNQFPGLPSFKNYILQLSPGYEILSRNYAGDLKKNLRIAAKNNLVYGTTDDVNLCLSNFKTTYASRLPQITSREYEAFGELCKTAGNQFELILRTAKASNGSILASALLLKKNGRMYLLQSYVSRTGRSMKANHFLIDRLIHEFAGIGLILDFEGSDVEGISHFYRNFGGTDQPYFFMKYNELPYFIKKIKIISAKMFRP